MHLEMAMMVFSLVAQPTLLQFLQQWATGWSVAFDGAAGTYGSINHGSGGLAVTKSTAHSGAMWVLGVGTANSDDPRFFRGNELQQ